jgi:hypothetical protein
VPTYREVTETIRKPDGSPWAGASVLFTLRPGSQVDDEQFPRHTFHGKIDADGLLKASDGVSPLELWANDEGELSSEYFAELPSGETFIFILPAGVGPISLSTLRAAYVGPSDPNYTSLLEAALSQIIVGLTMSGTAAAGKLARATSPSAVAWSDFTIANTFAAGEIAYASAANAITPLAKGTARQVLQMNAGATAPEWSSALSVGSVKLSDVIGAGAGVFRADSSLEISRPYVSGGPLFSLFDSTPIGVTGGECAIAYGGYDSLGGTPRKQISISSKWANATAATGFAVLRFNATYAGGTQDDVAMRIFGNNGISVFAGPGEDAAGDAPGQNNFSIGTGGAGRLGIGLVVPQYGLHVEQTAGVQVGSTNFYISANVGTSSKGVLLGYDNTAQVGVVASRGFSSALAFWTGTASTFSEAMRINAAQNLGIGSNDIEAWDVNHVGINFGGRGAFMAHKTTAGSIYMLSNAYNDGAWKYRAAAGAAMYGQVHNVHTMSVAASGSADAAITWVKAIEVDYSGAARIGVFGATPATKQTVTGSRGGIAALASVITVMATFGWFTDNTTA